MNAAWLEIEQRLKADIRSLLASINAAEARHLEDRHTWQALASEQAARADELERQRDRLAEIIPECPDQHFDEHFLLNGKVPPWCRLLYDKNGEPLGCDVTDVSRCWIQWAAQEGQP